MNLEHLAAQLYEQTKQTALACWHADHCVTPMAVTFSGATVWGGASRESRLALASRILLQAPHGVACFVCETWIHRLSPVQQAAALQGQLPDRPPSEQPDRRTAIMVACYENSHPSATAMAEVNDDNTVQPWIETDGQHEFRPLLHSIFPHP